MKHSLTDEFFVAPSSDDYFRTHDAGALLLWPFTKLRHAVRVMNEVLADLHLEQHPDKTFIGHLTRGFDFLGFDFDETGLTGSSERSLTRQRKLPSFMSEVLRKNALGSINIIG